MTYDLSDYVDVAERIEQFFEKWPNGSLVLPPGDDGVKWISELPGWRVTALAMRTPDDPAPGTGVAFQVVPGTTPYTRGSELENAQTSAWGRAIVAVGIPAKKIATRQDVERAQAHNAPPATPPPASAPATPPKKEQFPIPQKAKTASVVDTVNSPPADMGNPGDVTVHFGKNHGTRLGDMNERQIRWYAETWQPNPQYESKEDRRLKAAARALAGLSLFEDNPVVADDDIPFE